ncbi:MAG: hypothetical protein ACI957_002479 [Verrucomicrobiales bacterium]|jgi:hypothetical protein
MRQMLSEGSSELTRQFKAQIRLEKLPNQIGLPDPATTVNGDKLGFLRGQDPLKALLFSHSSYNHICLISRGNYELQLDFRDI